MAKLNLDDVIDVLQQNKIAGPQLNEIVKELNAVLNEAKNDKEDTPKKPKGKFVVLIKSENANLQKELEAGAYIVQVGENDDTTTLLSRIKTAARSHNDSLKRAKCKVTSFPTAMEFIKRKYSKEQNYLVKTKLPVEIQVVTEDKIV